jgi:hypothetical protein
VRGLSSCCGVERAGEGRRETEGKRQGGAQGEGTLVVVAVYLKKQRERREERGKGKWGRTGRTGKEDEEPCGRRGKMTVGDEDAVSEQRRSSGGKWREGRRETNKRSVVSTSSKMKKAIDISLGGNEQQRRQQRRRRRRRRQATKRVVQRAGRWGSVQKRKEKTQEREEWLVSLYLLSRSAPPALLPCFWAMGEEARRQSLLQRGRGREKKSKMGRLDIYAKKIALTSTSRLI